MLQPFKRLVPSCTNRTCRPFRPRKGDFSLSCHQPPSVSGGTEWEILSIPPPSNDEVLNNESVFQSTVLRGGGVSRTSMVTFTTSAIGSLHLILTVPSLSQDRGIMTQLSRSSFKGILYRAVVQFGGHD